MNLAGRDFHEQCEIGWLYARVPLDQGEHLSTSFTAWGSLTQRMGATLPGGSRGGR